MGSTVLHIQKYPNYPSFNPWGGGGAIFITARLTTGTILLIKAYTKKKRNTNQMNKPCIDKQNQESNFIKIFPGM